MGGLKGSALFTRHIAKGYINYTTFPPTWGVLDFRKIRKIEQGTARRLERKGRAEDVLRHNDRRLRNAALCKHGQRKVRYLFARIYWIALFPDHASLALGAMFAVRSCPKWVSAMTASSPLRSKTISCFQLKPPMGMV